MRPCEIFLNRREELLGHHGYDADPSRIERSPKGGIVFYHYTRPERLSEIFSSGGLWARLPVLASELTPDFAGYHFVEGLIEPFPRWLANDPYFGDLPMKMVRNAVGDHLLRIEVPADFPGLFVVDHAHGFECRHVNEYGRAALNLGYDCRTGHEVVRAFVHSYIPAARYLGGHVAPGIQAIRKGEGITIPKEYLSVSEQQPLKKPASGHADVVSQ